MTPLQSTLTGETLVTPLLYVAAGLAFGGVTYLSKDHEEIRPRQLAKTLVTFGVAGFIAYSQGDALNEATIVGATALAAPVVNTALDAVLPPSAGGSAKRGVRRQEKKNRR